MTEDFLDDRPVQAHQWRRAKGWREPEKMTRAEVTKLGLIGLGLFLVVGPVLGLVFLWLN